MRVFNAQDGGDFTWNHRFVFTVRTDVLADMPPAERKEACLQIVAWATKEAALADIELLKAELEEKL